MRISEEALRAAEKRGWREGYADGYQRITARTDPPYGYEEGYAAGLRSRRLDEEEETSDSR